MKHYYFLFAAADSRWAQALIGITVNLKAMTLQDLNNIHGAAIQDLHSFKMHTSENSKLNNTQCFVTWQNVAF